MESDNPIRHAKHIFRVVLLLVLVLVAIVLGRSLFVPKSWGKFGWYRGDNIAEQMAKPVQHRGNGSCKECHDEQYETHAAGAHQRVDCEVCHAPYARHVADNNKTADMPINRTKDLCLRCHRELQARPKSFPQVQARQHVDEQGGDWGEEVCIECHTPHEPTP